MQKSKFAHIADIVLLHAVVAVAAFLLFRCLLPAVPSYFAALGTTVAFFAAFAFVSKRRKKKSHVPSESLLRLALDPEYARDYFARALDARPDGQYLIKDATLYAPLFTHAPLTFKEVAPAYRRAEQLGLDAVVCLTDTGFDPDAAVLTTLERPTVKAVSGDALIPYLPQPVDPVRIAPKSERFALFKHVLDRNNARRYLLAALTLFGFSYLVPHAVYYLVFACLTFALGITCFFRKNTDRKKP